MKPYFYNVGKNKDTVMCILEVDNAPWLKRAYGESKEQCKEMLASDIYGLGMPSVMTTPAVSREHAKQLLEIYEPFRIKD